MNPVYYTIEEGKDWTIDEDVGKYLSKQRWLLSRLEFVRCLGHSIEFSLTTAFSMLHPKSLISKRFTLVERQPLGG